MKVIMPLERKRDVDFIKLPRVGLRIATSVAVLCVAVLLLAWGGSSVQAETGATTTLSEGAKTTFYFEPCTSNANEDKVVGGFSVDVIEILRDGDPADPSGDVLFVVRNNNDTTLYPSLTSYIDTTAFDDQDPPYVINGPHLIDRDDGDGLNGNPDYTGLLTGDPGVDFTPVSTTNTGNLRGLQNCGFQVSLDYTGTDPNTQFRSDADSPGADKDGIDDPDEYLGIVYSLNTSAWNIDYDSLINGMNACQLRVGIHVQGLNTAAEGETPNEEGSGAFASLCEPGTYVDLAGIDVEAVEGDMVIDWETAVEVDNAGFNLYRISSSDDAPVKINDQLIGAKGLGSGASYQYIDAGAPADSCYVLEDIDYNGTVTQYLPECASADAANLQLDQVSLLPIMLWQ